VQTFVFLFPKRHRTTMWKSKKALIWAPVVHILSLA